MNIKKEININKLMVNKEQIMLINLLNNIWNLFMLKNPILFKFFSVILIASYIRVCSVMILLGSMGCTFIRPGGLFRRRCLRLILLKQRLFANSLKITKRYHLH